MPILGTIASSTRQGLLTTSFESIATISLSSAQNNISFTSIPQTFTHLQLRFHSIGTTNNPPGTGFMRINGDTSQSLYVTHGIICATSGNPGTPTAIYLASSSGRSFVAFGGFNFSAIQPTYPYLSVMDILDYRNTNKNKVIRTISGGNNNNTASVGGEAALVSGLYISTSAITELTFIIDSGNFNVGTRIGLYGIKVAS